MTEALYSQAVMLIWFPMRPKKTDASDVYWEMAVLFMGNGIFSLRDFRIAQ